MSLQVPDACTLPTAEQPLRQAEFAALCRTSLRKQERLTARHLRLTLGREGRGDGELVETVRDMAVRENECCAFFDFTLTQIADVVVLDIEVPAAHSGVLDGLGRLADSAISRASRY